MATSKPRYKITLSDNEHDKVVKWGSKRYGVDSFPEIARRMFAEFVDGYEIETIYAKSEREKQSPKN